MKCFNKEHGSLQILQTLPPLHHDTQGSPLHCPTVCVCVYKHVRMYVTVYMQFMCTKNVCVYADIC